MSSTETPLHSPLQQTDLQNKVNPPSSEFLECEMGSDQPLLPSASDSSHEPLSMTNKRRKKSVTSRYFFAIVLVFVFFYLHHLSLRVRKKHYDSFPLFAFIDRGLTADSTHDPSSIGLRQAQANNLTSYATSLVPRFSLYTPLATVSSRRSDDHQPIVNVVVICHISNPCCYSTLPLSLRAIVRQSLMPDALKIIHSCVDTDERHLLLNTTHTIIHDNRRNVASLVQVSDKFCASTSSSNDYERCILTFLSTPSQRETAPYVLILSDRDVLESTAVEKKWMYLSLRSWITSVSSLSYNVASLQMAADANDPMQITKNVPSWNHTLSRSLSPLPLMYRAQNFKQNSSLIKDSDDKNKSQEWNSFINVISRGRLLREGLFTYLQYNETEADIGDTAKPLSLRYSELDSIEVPAYMLSDLAFYKWSARQEEDEAYDTDLSKATRINISPLRSMAIEASPSGHHIFFVMPWVQMGGSEKSMLDLAKTLLSMKWSVTFVLTMPDWREDSLGELEPQNQWLDKTLALTGDVFDLVRLCTYDTATRAFRHLLESRGPDHILLSNTRWAYDHSQLIRTILPATTIADYNHMIHIDWRGGGLPRFGANNSQYFDIHFTASMDVATPMESWIGERFPSDRPYKIKPCYIGTDPTLFHEGQDRLDARDRMRHEFNIPSNSTVVLFAGRFVPDKGLDVLIELINRVSTQTSRPFANELFFLIVGGGDQRDDLELAEFKANKGGIRRVMVRPPAAGISELRDYYAMSDVLLLPSVNEGIALVLYEAMAAGLLVITTDVGGQRELVTRDTGILIPSTGTASAIAANILSTLIDILRNPRYYERIRQSGHDTVRAKYTTKHFCDCIIRGLIKTSKYKAYKPPSERSATQVDASISKLSRELVKAIVLDRMEGQWKVTQTPRHVDKALTIGIKTYVCDDSTVNQISALIRSIRTSYPTVRVLLGNDGPTSLSDAKFIFEDPYTEEIRLRPNSGISYGRNQLVRLTTTKYFVLLDDDHVVDDATDFGRLIYTAEADGFDLVGMRIRNLPGIDELERHGIGIPRYVSDILQLKNRTLTLCIWNENRGPSVVNMRSGIKVDVAHNAFLVKTDAVRRSLWREELEVNEHMTFFLDAKKNGLKVGYLPNVFVHHRAREYSECYYATRFREQKFAELLDYEDQFLYDMECSKRFPDRVRTHMLREESEM